MIRDGWHLMVTNVPAAMQTVAQLVAIYSQRWLIEMAFRAWKQAGNMAKAVNRKSSQAHLKAVVLAGMIAMAIGLKTGLSPARSIPMAGCEDNETVHDTAAGPPPAPPRMMRSASAQGGKEPGYVHA